MATETVDKALTHPTLSDQKLLATFGLRRPEENEGMENQEPGVGGLLTRASLFEHRRSSKVLRRIDDNLPSNRQTMSVNEPPNFQSKQEQFINFYHPVQPQMDPHPSKTDIISAPSEERLQAEASAARSVRPGRVGESYGLDHSPESKARHPRPNSSSQKDLLAKKSKLISDALTIELNESQPSQQKYRPYSQQRKLERAPNLLVFRPSATDWFTHHSNDARGKGCNDPLERFLNCESGSPHKSRSRNRLIPAGPQGRIGSIDCPRFICPGPTKANPLAEFKRQLFRKRAPRTAMPPHMVTEYSFTKPPPKPNENHCHPGIGGQNLQSSMKNRPSWLQGHVVGGVLGQNSKTRMARVTFSDDLPDPKKPEANYCRAKWGKRAY